MVLHYVGECRSSTKQSGQGAEDSGRHSRKGLHKSAVFFHNNALLRRGSFDKLDPTKVLALTVRPRVVGKLSLRR